MRKKITKHRVIIVWIVCLLVFFWFLWEMLPYIQTDGMWAILGIISLVFVWVFVLGIWSIVTGLGKLYEKWALTKWHLLSIRVISGAGMLWWWIDKKSHYALNSPNLEDSTMLMWSRIIWIVWCLLIVRAIYRILWNKDKAPTQWLDYGPLRWNVLSFFGLCCIGRLIYTIFSRY